MEVGKSSKVYGLSFPTRHPKNEPKKIVESVFKDDSEEEPDEPTFKHIESSKNPIYQAKINRKTKSDLEKALEEDPSIFQYDEVLDDIHSKKDEDLSNLFSQAPRESKYVGRLLKSANERKLERELCAERKAQREIESEADLYKEKESFVTSAYKQKLVELRELVEKHKDEENREKVMDVTKQDGLGGFYRYMFDHETDRESSTQAGGETTLEERKRSDNPHEPNIKNSRSFGEEKYDKHCHSSRHPGIKHDRTKPESDRSSVHREKSDETHRNHSSSTRKNSSNIRDCGELRPEEPVKAGVSSDKPVKKVDYGPGFIAARPRVTTDEELEAARKRYLARKAAGIHALIVESD